MPGPLYNLYLLLPTGPGSHPGSGAVIRFGGIPGVHIPGIGIMDTIIIGIFGIMVGADGLIITGYRAGMDGIIVQPAGEDVQQYIIQIIQQDGIAIPISNPNRWRKELHCLQNGIPMRRY